MDSTDFLQDLETDAVRSREFVEALRRELTDDAVTWKPAPDVWSVAEIVEHLVTTTALYEEGMRKTLTRARLRPRARRSSFEPRRLAGWFVRMAGPTSERKLKAPKRFQPGTRRVGCEVLDRFVAQQGELIDLLRAAADADLNKPRFGSPITPLLRFSLGEALLLLIRHQQRHLAQAERVRVQVQAVSSR